MLTINANVHEMAPQSGPQSNCEGPASPASSDGIGSSCASSPTSSTYGDSLQTSSSSASSPSPRAQHSTPFPAHHFASKIASEGHHAFKPYMHQASHASLPASFEHFNHAGMHPFYQAQLNSQLIQSHMLSQQAHFRPCPSVSVNSSRHNSTGSSFEDSNYFSRNESIASPNLSQPRPTPKLSFSIDAILSKTDKKPAEQPTPIPVHPVHRVLPNSFQSPISRMNVNPDMLTSAKHESFFVQDNEHDNDSSSCLSSAKSKRKRRDSNCDSASNKRIRTIFTQDQLDKLEVEFLRQQYMVGSERTYLANSLNLSEAQVKIWFQNRRIKWRKSQAEESGEPACKSTENSDSFNSSSVQDD